LASGPELAAETSGVPARMPEAESRRSLPARVLLAAIRGYQLLLSPLFAGSCRYEPSCSRYMAEAVGRHGALWGGWLGIRRLARCHPFGSSGFDPVPEKELTEIIRGVVSRRNHAGSD
jgi:putative membrane protein insertion efficiency factor